MELLTKIGMIAPNPGYWGDHPSHCRLSMRLLDSVVMPPVPRIFGYFSATRPKLGADSRAGALIEWSSPLWLKLRSGVPRDLVSRSVRDTLWRAFLARIMQIAPPRVAELAECPPLRNEGTRHAR